MPLSHSAPTSTAWVRRSSTRAGSPAGHACRCQPDRPRRDSPGLPRARPSPAAPPAAVSGPRGLSSASAEAQDRRHHLDRVAHPVLQLLKLQIAVEAVQFHHAPPHPVCAVERRSRYLAPRYQELTLPPASPTAAGRAPGWAESRLSPVRRRTDRSPEPPAGAARRRAESPPESRRTRARRHTAPTARPRCSGSATPSPGGRSRR